MLRKEGFSLIELMVVIAIVGLLATIAVPAYRDYATRAKLASFNNVIEIFKNQVITFYTKNGTWPGTNDFFLDIDNDGYVDNPSTINQYINAISYSVNTAAPCGTEVAYLYMNTTGIDPFLVVDVRVGETPDGVFVTMCRDSIDFETSFQNNYFSSCNFGNVADFNSAICG